MPSKQKTADQVDISHLLPPNSLFSGLILQWFDLAARQMPWRKSRDPYAIWISEVMLQQTQVQTVIPYFLRFLAAFPTIESLAKAPLQPVLKLWAGLGYYRRAKQLHSAAKLIVQQYQGRFPREFPVILTLPGIGRYTAGAVGSIAFNLRVPVLDGNVMRVLARLLDFHGDIAQPAAQKLLWQIAADIIPADRPGDFNQAMMELGATVCKPLSPACDQCAVRRFCLAQQRGTAEMLPHKSKRTAVRTVTCMAIVLQRNEHTLLCKRPEGGLWSGLWEFPTFEIYGSKDSRHALNAAKKRATKSLGVDIEFQAVHKPVRHQLTHRLMIYQILIGSIKNGRRDAAADKWITMHLPYESARWVRGINSVPVARVTEKILAVAEAHIHNNRSTR